MALYVPRNPVLLRRGRRHWLLECCCPLRFDERGHRIPWINTFPADCFFGSLIVVSIVVCAVDIQLHIDGRFELPVFFLNCALLVAFVIELVLRVAADGFKELCSWKNPAGIFDAFLVLIQIIEIPILIFNKQMGYQNELVGAGAMRVFRVMRILRLVRILQLAAQLQLLLTGLFVSAQAVVGILLLFAVVMYTSAVFCTGALGRRYPENEELQAYFGSVLRSFYTHFMMATLENYPDVAHEAGEASSWWYVYVALFVVMSAMLLMSLVTGVVCDKVVTYATRTELEAHVYEEESKKFRKVMQYLCKVHRFFHEGEKELTEERFSELLKISDIREALDTLDICVEIEDKVFFSILDVDGSGGLSFDEFINASLRLRGSRKNSHSMTVQSEVIYHTQKIAALLRNAKEGTDRYAEKALQFLERKVLKGLDQIKNTGAHMADVSDVANVREAGVVSGSDRRPLPARAMERARIAARIANGASNKDRRSDNSRTGKPSFNEAAATQCPNWCEAPPEGLVTLLEAVEASGEVARQALANVKTQLEASRARVRSLEAQLRERSEAVQTLPEEGAMCSEGGARPAEPFAPMVSQASQEPDREQLVDQEGGESVSEVARQSVLTPRPPRSCTTPSVQTPPTSTGPMKAWQARPSSPPSTTSTGILARSNIPGTGRLTDHRRRLEAAFLQMSPNSLDRSMAGRAQKSSSLADALLGP